MSMLKKIKRLSAIICTVAVSLPLIFTSNTQAATLNNDIISENTSTNIRTELTYIQGIPGDTHLVYTYQEKGKQYKIIENSDNDFANVFSQTFVMNSDGNYEEIKSQEFNIQSDGNGYLTTTDTEGNSDISVVDVFNNDNCTNSMPDNTESEIALAYVDPGTGEWVMHAWDGSSFIFNMSVSVICAVLGSAVGGKVGATIGTIASEYFKVGADYAYYHVVDNKMMSSLYPLTVIIREASYTTYYLDEGHRYSTGSDYYEYDGRW